MAQPRVQRRTPRDDMGGLEPGTAPANDPAIWPVELRHDPGQFNQAVLDSYLPSSVRPSTCSGGIHIYTLLDMHQDVYNEIFDGEGGTELGSVHGRRAEHRSPGAVVPRVRDRRRCGSPSTILDQQRGR